jgi:hypothetical protein
LVYLLVLALILFALRPRQSLQNLKEMYTYRRWLLGVISTLVLLYIAFGLYQIWQTGLWWW